MVVEMIFVGTELLLGNILNTNAQYLSEQCAALGLFVYYQTVVGDSEERLATTIQTALKRADIILLSGGLGPTEDDLTKEVCAKVIELPLVEDPHTKARIKAYFKDLISGEIPGNNWKQAIVPKGALVLDNHNGTAPGLIVEKDKKTVVLLPGPPNELKPLFEEAVAPYFKKRQPGTIYSKMVKICGVGESKAETMIRDLIDTQTNPTLATYAGTGEVHIRITARAADEKEANRLIKPVSEEIKARFGISVFTTEESETLEEVVVKLLKKYKLTLTTAESCTGGLLAGRLINVPGTSGVFREGFITYSDKAKHKYLNVKESTLEKYSAYSGQTAREMAEGGAALTGSEACISVTGIAGPDGGTLDKPVGLVYIGCCLNHKTIVEEHHLKGNRDKIREQSVIKGLDLLRRCILEEMNS